MVNAIRIPDLWVTGIFKPFLSLRSSRNKSSRKYRRALKVEGLLNVWDISPHLFLPDVVRMTWICAPLLTYETEWSWLEKNSSNKSPTRLSIITIMWMDRAVLMTWQTISVPISQKFKLLGTPNVDLNADTTAHVANLSAARLHILNAILIVSNSSHSRKRILFKFSESEFVLNSFVWETCLKRSQSFPLKSSIAEFLQ